VGDAFGFGKDLRERPAAVVSGSAGNESGLVGCVDGGFAKKIADVVSLMGTLVSAGQYDSVNSRTRAILPSP
jgi:hypothetical protein